MKISIIQIKSQQWMLQYLKRIVINIEFDIKHTEFS